MPKIYTDEFKQSALDLVGDGMTQKQVCADLGISKSALQAWVRDSRLREHGLEPSRDPEESRAQAAALKRIRELERENKILREAAAYRAYSHEPWPLASLRRGFESCRTRRCTSLGWNAGCDQSVTGQPAPTCPADPAPPRGCDVPAPDEHR